MIRPTQRTLLPRKAARGVLLLSVLLLGCLDREAAPTRASSFGERLFHEPRFSDSAFNNVSCATCHDTGPQPSASRLASGGTLHGVTARPSYFGGYELSLLGAVNFCYVYFMRGAPFDERDPKGKALYEYLTTLGPAPPRTSAPVPLTLVRNVADVPPGDVRDGALLYARACAVCHGDAHSGRGRIDANTPILPEITSSYPRDFPGIAPRLVVIEKVRHGQFFGVGGNMPFFGLETLSDAELGAILAFLGL
jgi:thiosulfate dehydrogenase